MYIYTHYNIDIACRDKHSYVCEWIHQVFRDETSVTGIILSYVVLLISHIWYDILLINHLVYVYNI